jgi:hypothetical protein
MCRQIFILAAGLAATTGLMGAQSQLRRMTFVGGGSPDRGKCTIEVVVDGSAEVEVRGDSASLRNLSGAAPQWRRFECNGPLPRDPVDFRFAGVDGRGRQRLIRDPHNGGAAVIQIQDSGGGTEGYTFDLFWRNAGRAVEAYGAEASGGDRERFYRDRSDAFRGEGWRMHMFSRIREDLEQVEKFTFPFGRDEFRIAQAKVELNQLQEMQRQGRYDLSMAGGHNMV